MLNCKTIPELSDKDKIRFLDLFVVNKCWQWKGSKRRLGYGEFHFKGDSYLAHRVSYEMFYKVKVPNNMSIDHLCRNTSCVNPDHLEVVTAGENARRARNAQAKPDCAQGHLLAGSNLFINNRGHRVCKKCRYAGIIKVRAKKKIHII